MSENILPSCISLPLSGKELEEIVSKAKDYALMHGICMRSKANFNPDNLQFAPFVLTPSLYPRKEFEKATKLQIILNKMIHNVAHDVDFLRETLASTIKMTSQHHSLKSMKQFYRKVLLSYILQELGHDDKVKYLPENNALAGLCDAMVEAWKIIGDDKAAILFIIEDVTYNICDQRFHEFYIREKYPHVKVIRQSLTEIFKEGKLGDNKTLIVGNVTASVVYFRAGYEPGHYHSENEWAARLMIERSTAIKCPSVHYHLAGTKKVQQALAKPGVLNRFLNDENEIKQVKEIFTGLYSFDKGEGGDETVKMVLEKPENFVMKPQREGGGNNIYGVDIPERLKAMDETERSAYILMERIFPPISKSYMIRPGGPNPPPIFDMVSELGIFGAIIGTKEKILYNRQVGHMLRTKVSSANEGGVAAGLGALDSVYLTNEF
ncbi:CLUMA_CG015836, isoform C [Clunio marinus]|uniref:Glutathione synthetase n=1 Tax=Clunio marinus TaxID=568069 RepID=A0A1J1IVM6_9DIPT|nr:CLUMA_CG015836, isoform C [Clunio marinus]